jgi:hypothetical protein
MAGLDTQRGLDLLAHDRVKWSWVEYDGVRSQIGFVKVQVIVLFCWFLLRLISPIFTPVYGGYLYEELNILSFFVGLENPSWVHWVLATGKFR